MHSFSSLKKKTLNKHVVWSLHGPAAVCLIIWHVFLAGNTLALLVWLYKVIQCWLPMFNFLHKLNSFIVSSTQATKAQFAISPCSLFWSRPQWRHSRGKAEPTVPVGSCLASGFWPHPAKVRLKKQWPPNRLGPSTQKWLEKSCWRYFTQPCMSPQNVTSYCGSASAVCGWGIEGGWVIRAQQGIVMQHWDLS